MCGLEQFKVREWLEVFRVVGEELCHAVGEHRCYDLQIEHMRAPDRAGLEYGNQTAWNFPRNREDKNVYVCKKDLNEPHRFARRIRICLDKNVGIDEERIATARHRCQCGVAIR